MNGSNVKFNHKMKNWDLNYLWNKQIFQINLLVINEISNDFAWFNGIGQKDDDDKWSKISTLFAIKFFCFF